MSHHSHLAYLGPDRNSRITRIIKSLDINIINGITHNPKLSKLIHRLIRVIMFNHDLVITYTTIIIKDRTITTRPFILYGKPCVYKFLFKCRSLRFCALTGLLKFISGWNSNLLEESTYFTYRLKAVDIEVG